MAEISPPLTPQARAVLLNDKFAPIFYAAHGAGGLILDGNPALPMPGSEIIARLGREGRAYYDGTLDEEPIRLAVLQKELGGQTVTILAAETMVKLHQVAEHWLPKAIDKEIDLGFELSPATIQGNEILLQELLGNLLDNVLRHTPRGGGVTVSCGESAGHAWLKVEDSGPGIAENECGRIFERFYRPPGQSSDGCGLGLAIVREIARQHHGAVEVSVSARWQGALMHFVLPKGQAALGEKALTN